MTHRPPLPGCSGPPAPPTGASRPRPPAGRRPGPGRRSPPPARLPRAGGAPRGGPDNGRAGNPGGGWGETGSARAAAGGGGPPPARGVKYARRARGRRGRPATGWSSLTPTELEVVRLVADGLTNPQIGARLLISRGTVKTHLSHIFIKLDTSNRAQLAAAAIDRRLPPR